jgi:hypothetical protein
MGAKIRAEKTQEAAPRAQRDADRAEAELVSLRMEGFGGPAQPSANASTADWRSLRSSAIGARRARAYRSSRSDGRATRRSGSSRPHSNAGLAAKAATPPVHMIRLTEKQEIAPYRWVHPNEER